MKLRSRTRRRAADFLLKAVSTFSAFVGLFFLAWILIVVAHRGISAINWSFFSQLPPPPGGEGGGLGNAMLGTLYMTTLSVVIGVPLGVFAGVYLSEYGRETQFGALVRFTTNVMMGIPSIITGLFIYTLVVVTTGHFSGYAGAFSLALLILPIVARTSRTCCRLSPIRCASRHWRWESRGGA